MATNYSRPCGEINAEIASLTAALATESSPERREQITRQIQRCKQLLAEYGHVKAK